MKAIFAALILVFSTGAFAGQASEKQIKLLCNTIDKAAADQSFDMALDTKACLKNKKIQASLLEDGSVRVSGKLKFNVPQRPSFYTFCELIYGPKGVIEDTVSCR